MRVREGKGGAAVSGEREAGFLDVFLGITLVALVVFLIGFTGFCIGSGSATKEARDQAIEHNAAYWSIDPKTGKTEFKWREQP